MQRAEIVEAFKPLKITSHPIPEVPDEGVVIRTLYAGICHSDLHFIDDETDIGNGKVFRHRDVLGERFQGIVPGHEISGKVIAVGSKVPRSCSLKPGDNVIVYPWRGCRGCEVCSMGYNVLCENNPSGTKDVGQGGCQGGYSTHIALPEWDLAIKLPKNINPAVGAMLPCSVLTSYSAILKARPALDLAVRVRGVANLLIIGAGGLGFWAIILIKNLFCDKNVKVIIADISQEKLTEASNIGADDAVLWGADDSIEDLISNTTMSGYNKMDAVIDYVGLPKTSETGLMCLHHGGTMIVVGLNGGQLPLTLPLIISRSLSVQGVRLASRSTLTQLVDLFAVQGIDTIPTLEFFSLKDINIALDKLREGKIKARALIKYE